MNINIGLIIAGVFLLFVIVGGIAWYAIVRGKFRFDFRVWSKDLKSSYLAKARISIDKENKNNRLFTFKNNPSRLIMRDPVHWAKGKPERWVIADESGEYQYLAPDKTNPIDDKVYMSTRMHPVDKQLAIEGIRNAQKRYETDSKVGLVAFMSLIALCAVLIIGMIYGIGVLTKNANAVGDNSRILKDMQVSHDANTIRILESMQIVTNNLAYIYGQINGDSNVSIVVPIGGVKP